MWCVLQSKEITLTGIASERERYSIEFDDGNHEVTAEEVHQAMADFHLRRRQFPQDDAARRAKSSRIRRKNK